MCLANLIEDVDAISEERVNQLSTSAKRRISEEYSWDIIVSKYEKLFIRV
jgi:rhamnosyltransferase